MSDVAGTYRDGYVELDSAVEWPDGSRVRVRADSGNSAVIDWGIDPSDYRDTPEYRANLIAQMDAFEPLELTPAEEAEWLAARQWIKEHSIAAVRQQMGLDR